MSLSVNSRSPRRGFNLTETLVAMMVLAIAIFGVVSVNAYTLRATKANKNRQIANMIACTQMALVESVLKINFHTPEGNINTPRLRSNQFPDFTFVVEDLGYEDPTQTLRGARTRVFWDEEGVDRTYVLETTFYNY